jgi:hypothetical protein
LFKKYNLSSEPLIAVLVITVILAITYLPLVNSLGFYHDDWFTTASEVSGISLSQMHSIDRPLMGKLYEFTYSFLGDRPLNWHLAIFAARLAGALGVFWLVRMLWPQQRQITFLITLLFGTYPGFLMIPNANNYLNHFVAFGLAIFSLAFTVRAWLSPHWPEKILLTGLAAGSILIYPRIYESIIGLEALRVLFLVYLLLRENRPALKQAAYKIGLVWLPYLGSLSVFLYWRLFIFKSVRAATDSGALAARYLSDPTGMLVQIIIESLKDLFETVYLAYGVPLYKLASQAHYADLAWAALLAAMAIYIIRLYDLYRQRNTVDPVVQQSSRSLILLGLAGAFFALLPAILADRDVRFSYTLDRYTLQATLGCAILLGGLILAALQSGWRLHIALLLIAISIFTHFNNAAYYRDLWTLEKQYFWQLTWRAPQLETGTALAASLPEDYNFAEGFEVWAPANLIYAPQPGPLRLTAEVINQDTIRDITYQQQVKHDFRTIQFTKDYRNTLGAVMPQIGNCLRVLDKNYPELAGSNILFRSVAFTSRPERIITDAQPARPPATMFGAEPEHTWCYYYQKAWLARQQNNLTEAVRLGEDVLQNKLAPQDPLEWVVFLEIFADANTQAPFNQVVSQLKNTPAKETLCPRYSPTISLSPRTQHAGSMELIWKALCQP